jgi:hypothetical protein
MPTFYNLVYILGLAHNDTLEFLPCEKYVEAFFKCVIMGQNIDKVIKCLAYTQLSHFEWKYKISNSVATVMTEVFLKIDLRCQGN